MQPTILPLSLPLIRDSFQNPNVDCCVTRSTCKRWAFKIGYPQFSYLFTLNPASSRVKQRWATRARNLRLASVSRMRPKLPTSTSHHLLASYLRPPLLLRLLLLLMLLHADEEETNLLAASSFSLPIYLAILISTIAMLEQANFSADFTQIQIFLSLSSRLDRIT